MTLARISESSAKSMRVLEIELEMEAMYPRIRSQDDATYAYQVLYSMVGPDFQDHLGLFFENIFRGCSRKVDFRFLIMG